MSLSLRRLKRRVRQILSVGKIGFRTAQEHLREGRPQLPYKILVGAHHKTGTAWMHSVFAELSWDLGLTYHYGEQRDLPHGWDVLLQEHSGFDRDSLPPNIRGLHLIRDPRDIIVSGTFYHQRSIEPWLHVRRPEYGGSTYQEKINSYDSLDDKLMFEMENSGSQTIKEMRAWDYHNPAFLEVKYETLIQDQYLTHFHEVFVHLGLPGQLIPHALGVAYRNSLFSGKVQRSVHVRSGKTAQWKRHLNAAHRTRFLQLFGDALVTLGYESDDSWVED